MNSPTQYKKWCFLPPLTRQTWAVLIICIVYYVVWAVLLTSKYFRLGYYDWDLAIYAHTMWNLTQGRMSTTIFGGSFLINHAHYIAFLLTPLYAAFPTPLTLIYLKIFSVAAGGFVLFLIASRILRNNTFSLILLISYLIYPTNLLMLSFEFQFENLAIFPICLMLYFLQKESLKGFLISAFFLTLIKENMPLLLIAFGIYAFFKFKSKRLYWSVLPIAFGVFMCWFSLSVLIPMIRHAAGIEGPSHFSGLYPSVHTPETLTLFQKITAVVTSTTKILFSKANLRFLMALFGPLAFYAVFAPGAIFLMSPLLLQNMLTTTWTMKTIYYHYTATMTPFIFFAIFLSLSFIFQKLTKPLTQKILVWAVLVICFSMSFSGIRVATEKLYLKKPASLAREQWQLINKVDRNAGVIASFEFLDSLSNRKELYPFYYIWLGSHPFLHTHPYQLPETAEFALLNLQDTWSIKPILEDKDAISRITKFLNTNEWTAVDWIEDTLLLKHGTQNTTQLVSVSRDSPLKTQNKQIFLGDSIILQSFESDYAAMTESQNVLSINLIWKALKPPEHLYSIVLMITRNGRPVKIAPHFIGYLIYPTTLWKPHEVIRENYKMKLPDHLSPGSYDLLISIYDTSFKTPYELKIGEDQGTYIKIGKIDIH